MPAWKMCLSKSVTWSSARHQGLAFFFIMSYLQRWWCKGLWVELAATSDYSISEAEGWVEDRTGKCAELEEKAQEISGFGGSDTCQILTCFPGLIHLARLTQTCGIYRVGADLSWPTGPSGAYCPAREEIFPYIEEVLRGQNFQQDSVEPVWVLLHYHLGFCGGLNWKLNIWTTEPGH